MSNVVNLTEIITQDLKVCLEAFKEEDFDNLNIFANRTMANCILDSLTDPILLQKINDEWKAAKEGRKYVSPIPPDLKPPLDQFQPK